MSRSGTLLTVGTRAWAWWLLFAAAAAIAVAVALSSRPPAPASPQQASEGTFTWEGTTWDCAQVNAWDYQYGAYEPDGTPIPYEVVASCQSREATP